MSVSEMAESIVAICPTMPMETAVRIAERLAQIDDEEALSEFEASVLSDLAALPVYWPAGDAA